MSRFRLFFGLFLIVVGLSSCRPRNVLSRSEMTDVLFDIHLTESITEGMEEPVPDKWLKGLNPGDFRDLAYQSVLRKHKISEETFLSSVAYYSKNMRVYLKIYQDVDKRLADYLLEIKSGKYGTESLTQTLSQIKIDTVRTRAWFRFFINGQTGKQVPFFCLHTDSVANLASKAYRWFHPYNPDTVSFRMVDPKVAIRDTVFKTDSIGSIRMVSSMDSLRMKQKEIVTGIRRRQPGYRNAQSGTLPVGKKIPQR